jgi:hypothetical protein
MMKDVSLLLPQWTYIGMCHANALFRALTFELSPAGPQSWRWGVKKSKMLAS